MKKRNSITPFLGMGADWRVVDMKYDFNKATIFHISFALILSIAFVSSTPPFQCLAKEGVLARDAGYSINNPMLPLPSNKHALWRLQLDGGTPILQANSLLKLAMKYKVRGVKYKAAVSTMTPLQACSRIPAYDVMIANGKNKLQEQQNKKKKCAKQNSSLKACVKKVVHNPLEHNKDLKEKKKSHKARPKKDVHNSHDKTNKGLQQVVNHFTNHLKSLERNENQKNSRLPELKPLQMTPPHINLQVIARAPVQVYEKQTRMKKSKKLELQNRPSSKINPKKQNAMPLRLPLHDIVVPLSFPYAENQGSHRTTSWAQALVMQMDQKSRLSIPQVEAQLQGLSALASDLPPKQNLFPKMAKEKCGAEDSCCLREETQVLMTEVSEPTAHASLFENSRPGSQKLMEPLGVDRRKWQRLEIERQQDRKYAQKIVIRKKELRYFRRLEGVGQDIDDLVTNTMVTPSKVTKSIGNIPIMKDVEESSQGYSKFFYRPWQNLGSDSVSMSSLGPTINFRSSTQTESTRPTSCDTKKSTSEIVMAISSANARREVLRKELAQRLWEHHSRRKLFVSQECTTSRHLQCSCC